MDIIVGAGITGLCYALFKGDAEYLVLEKESEIGGYCRTTKRNGFVWDYSGHFFHFQDTKIKDMIASALPPNEMVNVTKCTSIKYGDRLIDFPFQKNIHQLPKGEFIDCLVDLFSVTEPDCYETFKEMLYKKFGRSIAEKFLIPYNEKLYACELDILDKHAMGRFFPYADKEEIVRGFGKCDGTSYNGSFLYPRGGAIEYVKAIASRLDSSRIKTCSEVDYINTEDKKVMLKDGKMYHYDNLISTVPFPRLLDLCGMHVGPSSVYSWNKVLVFNLGFDRKGPERRNHWIYFPERKYAFYRVGFYDNILNQDRTSLYVELGFDKNAKINEEVLLDRILIDLKVAGIITSEMKLVDSEVLLMDPAYVHINELSQEAVRVSKQLLATKNVYSIGRYGSWTYCSIEDNIKEARDLAFYNKQTIMR